MAHYCIHVRYIHMIHKILRKPPLQITNSARKRTEYKHRLWRRCTGVCVFSSVLFWKECLTWCVILVRFGLLCRLVDQHCQKCLSQPQEDWTIHPSMKGRFIVPGFRHIVAILGISQHSRKTWYPSSMNPPCSWSTLSRVSFHRGLQFC